jgi:multisubunit Na+/H+ antiporter MnhB subunit
VIPVRSRILDVGVRAVFHTFLLFSLFLLFRGHNQPGGGFSGGLVAGAAFVLLWVARGPVSLRFLRAAPETVVGLGLLVAVGTGLAALIGGGEFLQSGSLTIDAAAIGTVKVHSVLAFDIGVYLVVLGFVTLALQRLGTDLPDDRGVS